MTQYKHQQLSHPTFQPSNWKLPGWKSLLSSVWDSDSGIPYMSEFSPEKLSVQYSSMTAQVWQPIATHTHPSSEVSSPIEPIDRLETILSAAIARVCQEADWDYAEAWMPDGDRQLLKSSSVWYCRNEKLKPFRELSQTLTFAPGAGLPGRVWISQKPLWEKNAARKSERVFLRENIARQYGIGTVLGIPIALDRQVLGVLVFLKPRGHCSHQQAIDIVWALTEQISLCAELHSVQTLATSTLVAQTLYPSEMLYCNLVENTGAGLFQSTPEGQYLAANPRLAAILGYDSPAQMLAMSSSLKAQLYVHPNRYWELVQLLDTRDRAFGFESQVYRRDGSIIWVRENTCVIRDELGRVLRYEGIVEDITETKQTEAKLLQRDRLLSGAAESMHHLIADLNHQTAIEKALATLGQATNVDRVYICECQSNAERGFNPIQRFEWRAANSLSHSQSRPLKSVEAVPIDRNRSRQTLQQWYSAWVRGSAIEGRMRELRTADRALLSAADLTSLLALPIHINGALWGYLGFGLQHEERQWDAGQKSILQAIAVSLGHALQRYQVEMLVQHQAFHDSLTGLPNRTLFDRCLRGAIERAQTQNHSLAVMFLDLDRFKLINDTLGHPVGDSLLQQTVARLERCLREDDTIARWGGDEFILLLPHIHSIEDAAQIAQRILTALQPAFEIDEHQLHISSSVGISLYPEDGTDADTLTKNADVALYRAKDKGRNNYQFYRPDMSSEASELLILRNSIHYALERQEFEIYYQPQVNPETGQITGVEALTYWRHPELGLVSPKVFIPLAEEMGLMVSIGEWVLQTACAQNKAWQNRGFAPIAMAVNLSARQFKQRNFVKLVSNVLQKTQLEPQFLELEITETIAMQDISLTATVLEELHQMGIQIAMDDFGIGYASLSYLKQFPFNKIKIDRSFIQELTFNPKDMAIAQAIVTLGRGLNLSVVAEGVETEEQREFLRSLNFEGIQGYVISIPLIAEEATRLLERANFKQPKIA
jgi:diguanylate cyclase (GGDEF)-like protein/PAS domain S-box-containing protein